MADKKYIKGERAAWRVMLRASLKSLGYDSKESTASNWVVEREEAIAALRGICETHGDNDWDETLSLADVIEKHLAAYL